MEWNGLRVVGLFFGFACLWDGIGGGGFFDEPSLVRNWINSTTYRPMSPFAVSEIRATEGTAFFMILITAS